MKFKSYILTFISSAFLGVSCGYIVGFYIGQDSSLESSAFYFSVPLLAISSFLLLYSVLYLNK